ncbi:MAG TPA: DNA/RNA non-specific endonuclease [Tenuifilaceae bacterium]|nr:DNA/RNA non-specific endonuclease [Tenuifilaceae bacterium]
MKSKRVISRVLLSLLLTGTALFFSCEKDEFFDTPMDVLEQDGFQKSSTVVENFENATKTSYTAGSVSLPTGSWYLNDALLGTLSTDRKFGSKSVRIRNAGKLTMQFNVTSGASTVEVYHAKFGSDGNSTWALYKSTNNGSTWTKVGSTITTSSTSLSKVTFTVNQSGNVRFEIRKLSGGSYRINIDDFKVNLFAPPSPTRDNNMALGNPSGATTSTSNSNNYLMVKTQYALSYNNSKKTSNWVSWHLSEAWLGNTPRQDNFRADYALPSSWIKVGGSDYSGSGFDRGHMCPSADRNGSVADNSATFLMTNMIPQSPKNNQITWAALENYCRDLVSQGNELYIISGPWGQGGTGSNGYYSSISSKNITVPSYTWKIIVVLPVGTNDVARINTSTRVIAVWMPNNQTVNSQSWGYYRTTVDYIESKTGYNFISNVSNSIQSVIESQVDNGPTS